MGIAEARRRRVTAGRGVVFAIAYFASFVLGQRSDIHESASSHARELRRGLQQGVRFTAARDQPMLLVLSDRMSDDAKFILGFG
jgi:hypothetical protein